MKRNIIVAIIGTGIIGGALFLNGNFVTVETYTATSTPQVIIETEEIEEDEKPFAERISQAQEADMKRIKTNAEKAYKNSFDHDMSLIEDSVLAEVEREINARRVEIQKETGVY